MTLGATVLGKILTNWFHHFFKNFWEINDWSSEEYLYNFKLCSLSWGMKKPIFHAFKPIGFNSSHLKQPISSVSDNTKQTIMKRFHGRVAETMSRHRCLLLAAILDSQVLFDWQRCQQGRTNRHLIPRGLPLQCRFKAICSSIYRKASGCCLNGDQRGVKIATMSGEN